MNDSSAALPVALHIISKSLDHEQEQTQQLEGQLYHKHGRYYLRYTEETEDNEEVHNTLKMDNHHCTVMRSGALRMRHVYREGETTQGTYHTPHGSFLMETKTEQMQFSILHSPPNDSNTDPQAQAAWHPFQGEIRLHYQLKLDEQPVGRFQLLIHMEEQGGTD